MKKSNTGLYLTAIFAVALLIGVGYAALSATLNINGQTTINKASWDVHFENIATNDSTAIKFYAADDTDFSNALTNIADLSGTTLNYTVNLTGPDSTAETTHDMTADIVNKGTIDATVSSVSVPTGTSSEYSQNVTPENGALAMAQLTTISCTYSDGSAIKVGDVIKAGTSKTITCKHHYKSPSELTQSDLDTFTSLSTQTVTGKFAVVLNFVAK